MKIMVAVKRVADPNVKVRLLADGSGIDPATIKMTMNPFDEIAVEEAVQLKETRLATEVVVSIGAEKATETLRTALAMGVDRGLLIKTDEAVEPLSVAKLLKAVATEEKPSLVFLGKQAIDDDCNQTGQMLAAQLGWAQGTFASQVSLGDSKATVVREVDSGSQTVELSLPAIVNGQKP